MRPFFHPILASILFFTRIPIGTGITIPGEAFKRIIFLWPFTGWITGALLAGSWWGFSQLFPGSVALILALMVRVLFTGALHEDGLGDFIDGFGGGHDKTTVLRIMKDSHVGSYALIGMIFYFLLFFSTLSALPKGLLFALLLAADPLSKMFAAIITTLPYARPENESKFKVLFEPLRFWQWLVLLFCGLSPLLILLPSRFWIAALAPLLTLIAMRFYVKRKIGGYTGDICGASFLMCELSFFLAILLLLN